MNQLDLRPKVLRNWSPVRVTEPAEPVIWMDVTRPPQSPNPLRPSTVSPVNVPMAGYLASIAPASNVVDQV